MEKKTFLLKKVCRALFVLVTLLGGAGAFSGCVSDPEQLGPNPGNLKPTENPMSELTIPNGFDWATMYTLQLSVQANDEYLGEYYYVVEVWDENPYDASVEAHLLSKGVSKKGEPYLASLSIPKGVGELFVCQIDPRGRKVMRSYEVADGMTELTCDFSASGSSSKRSLSLQAAGDEIVPPEYRSLPDGATEISVQVAKPVAERALQNQGVYKITEAYSGGFMYATTMTSAQLFITGTWTLSSTFQIEKGLEIIVLPGGKIKGGSLNFQGSSQLVIMPGGSVDMVEIQCSNANKVYNLGALKLDKFYNNPDLFYNGEKAVATIKTFLSEKNRIYNYGSMKLGQSICQGSTKWYNYCLVEVQDQFKFYNGELVLEKGTILADRIQLSSNTVQVLDGSLLSALSALELAYTVTLNGGGTGVARSLVQSPKLTYNSGNVFKGNLTVECDNYDPKTQGWQCKFEVPVEITGYKESALTIASCDTTTNEGNPGGDPQDPVWPLITEDLTTYSYAFEDNWPIYGDYDMNDVVVYITKRQLATQKSGAITSYTVQGKLMAVGASKQIAAALRLAGIPASKVKTVQLKHSTTPGANLSFFDLNSANVEKGQTNIVIPVFGNAHEFLTGKPSKGLINTYAGQTSVQPQMFEIEISFDESAAITESNLRMEFFDLFLITNQKNAKRQEVHLPAFNPTDLANPQWLETGNCVGSAAPYLSAEGLSFGLMVPDVFRWPIEYNTIRKAYLNFAPWILSGGTAHQEWYKEIQENEVYPVIR